MFLGKFRSSKYYICCGRIGVFLVPIALIIVHWNSSFGMFSRLIGFLTFLPLYIIYLLGFIILSICACVNSKHIEDEKTDIMSDIGYVMFIILVLIGIPLFLNL